MRQLATIQKITALNPIPGADKIEVATVLGWQVVVAKRDNLRVGDKIIYVEIDSILPERPEFEFMRERRFRVKTIKLKSQVSQGICFPIKILESIGRLQSVCGDPRWETILLIPSNDKAIPIVEGEDVTEVLGIRKYDPQAEWEKKETDKLQTIHKNRMVRFMNRYSWFRRLMFRPTRVPFPPFIKKTDEDRIQLFPDYHERWGHLKFEVTEKIDGQSATYFVIQNPERGLFKPRWIFGVCSRNFQLVKPDDSSYWSVAKKYDLKNKLIDLCDGGSTGIILQGEIIGNKIQGNKYNTDGYKFFMFNALLYNNGNSKAYNEIEMSMLAYRLGINRVPTLYAYQSLPDSIEKMVQLSSGVSKIAGVPREGIVVRNYDNNISFKVINPEFLLKYND